MSADVELLRKAARLMRERATGATPGPWKPDGEIVKVDERRLVAEAFGLADKWPNAAHIASWHPAVALAVADWLDGVADDHRAVESVDVERGECVVGTVHEGFYRRTSARHILPALAVARAYLGAETPA